MDNPSYLKAPLLIIGYNRPEFIERRLLNCYELRNREIHISLDYHSSSTTIELIRILEKHQVILEKHNSVIVTFQNKNLGLAQHVTTAISEILCKRDNIIVIEDDINFNSLSIDSLDFGLRHLELDSSLASVGMFSPVNLTSCIKPRNMFRNSKYFACWGWGTTKKVWGNYILDISNLNLEGILSNSLLFSELSQQQKNTWLGRFNKLKSNTFHTWDIQFQLMSFQHNLKHLLPIFSISNNEGFADPRSVHTKGNKPRWMKSYILPNHNINKVSKSFFISHLMDTFESYTLVGDRKIKNLFKS